MRNDGGTWGAVCLGAACCTGRPQGGGVVMDFGGWEGKEVCTRHEHTTRQPRRPLTPSYLDE